MPSNGYLSCLLQRPIKESDHTCFQRILGSNHEQTVFLDQLLKDVGAMRQVIHRCPNVGPHGLTYQHIDIIAVCAREQCFNRGSHTIDDRHQVAGLIFLRSLELFERGQDCTALRVAEDHHEPRVITCGGEFHTTDLRWSYDVTGNTNDEKVSEPLVEHQLSRHSRIRASEDDREGLLTRRQLGAPVVAEISVRAAQIRNESHVALAQALQRFEWGDHDPDRVGLISLGIKFLVFLEHGNELVDALPARFNLRRRLDPEK